MEGIAQRTKLPYRPQTYKHFTIQVKMHIMQLCLACNSIYRKSEVKKSGCHYIAREWDSIFD